MAWIWIGLFCVSASTSHARPHVVLSVAGPSTNIVSDMVSALKVDLDRNGIRWTSVVADESLEAQTRASIRTLAMISPNGRFVKELLLVAATRAQSDWRARALQLHAPSTVAFEIVIALAEGTNVTETPADDVRVDNRMLRKDIAASLVGDGMTILSANDAEFTELSTSLPSTMKLPVTHVVVLAVCASLFAVLIATTVAAIAYAHIIEARWEQRKKEAAARRAWARSQRVSKPRPKK